MTHRDAPYPVPVRGTGYGSEPRRSRHVWGEYRANSAIEKLVSRLRHKVDKEHPALIRTRRDFGYWLGRPGRRNVTPAR
ncbi:hypothetical protein GCM10027073_39400 [Streptomyces chlorus]|uniref:Helix-turn-helix domain-containing protein n=1 Tax=Streptomyces chlorus TaxID=887452 RepID=A0ABW1DVZ4_9ACTN